MTLKRFIAMNIGPPSYRIRLLLCRRLRIAARSTVMRPICRAPGQASASPPTFPNTARPPRHLPQYGTPRAGLFERVGIPFEFAEEPLGAALQMWIGRFPVRRQRL